MPTKIEWTDDSWNPVTGCTKISAGCDHCYAERFSERFRGVLGNPFSVGFDLTLRPERLLSPLKQKKGRRIFVNSMSDLFHKDIPLSFINEVFDVMEAADWHTFQVLTKRSSLMQEYLIERYGSKDPPRNIWFGVSIENQAALSRMEHLKRSPGVVRFLSLEPLLQPLQKMDLDKIHWVIVGGESGPGARPMDPSWVVAIRDMCLEQRVPFFFKQWGGARPKKTGRILEGFEWSEFPRTVC